MAASPSSNDGDYRLEIAGQALLRAEQDNRGTAHCISPKTSTCLTGKPIRWLEAVAVLSEYRQRPAETQP